jgi:hypothetical protein
MFTVSARRLLTATLALGLGLAVAEPRRADALTISLGFVTGPTVDLFGVGTTTANYGAFGFTGMTTPQIESAILGTVFNDYLGYPTIGANASSPLPFGKELNVNFVMASSITAPTNGDSEYYHIAIGNKTGAQSFLGQACYACVRDGTGAGPNFGLLNGSIVGSVLVNNIATLAGLAASDAQRINLLAGTVAHEIGHIFGLDHPNGALANPGDSAFSLMATGAAPTSMPNAQRVLDRDFAYSEFDQLIDAIGLRDSVPVPEPGSIAILALGSVLVALRVRRRARIG